MATAADPPPIIAEDPDTARVGVRRRIGLALGPLFFILVLLLPTPAEMPAAAWSTAAVAALMIVWWITEAIPIPVTSLLPLVLFPLLDVLPITPAAAPYANPVIFLFMGGFIIAIALERCGLHRRMALTIIRAVGTKPAALIGGFMAATAFLSMWVSNTATVLMMLPMATSVIGLVEEEDRKAGRDPDQRFAVALFLSLAYASNIGGMGTLIGTPPNALLAGFMSEAYGVQIGFVQWMLVGVPLVVVALPLTWLILTKFLHPVRSGTTAGAEVIRREVAALGSLSRAELTVGTITALTATAWVARPLIERIVPQISDAGIAMAGALLMFIVPINWRRGETALHWKQAEKLPWSVLLLFGGGLSLANAFQQTGLATWLGNAAAGIDAFPLVLIVMAITAMIIFLTEVTSNTATAATFLPIVGALAVGMGADPLLFALPAALAASCAFMMPVATPPNAIIYASERVTIPQMAKAGIWLNLLFIALITAIAFWLEPHVFVVRTSVP